MSRRPCKMAAMGVAMDCDALYQVTDAQCQAPRHNHACTPASFGDEHPHLVTLAVAATRVHSKRKHQESFVLSTLPWSSRVVFTSTLLNTSISHTRTIMQISTLPVKTLHRQPCITADIGYASVSATEDTGLPAYASTGCQPASQRYAFLVPTCATAPAVIT